MRAPHPPRKPRCDLHRTKKPYNSSAAAERALENIKDYGSNRGGGKGKPQRAYQCPGCSKWFLTSQAQ